MVPFHLEKSRLPRKKIKYCKHLQLCCEISSKLGKARPVLDGTNRVAINLLIWDSNILDDLKYWTFNIRIKT